MCRTPFSPLCQSATPAHTPGRRDFDAGLAGDVELGQEARLDEEAERRRCPLDCVVVRADRGDERFADAA